MKYHPCVSWQPPTSTSSQDQLNIRRGQRVPSLLKGIVHPKMKILSFTIPQVVHSNLYECVCSAEHMKIFWRMRETEQFWIIVLFFSTMEVKGALKQPDYKLSSEYLHVFSRINTFRQVWKYLRASKLWHNFHFWVNYPFKVSTKWKFTLSIFQKYIIDLFVHIYIFLKLCFSCNS